MKLDWLRLDWLKPDWLRLDWLEPGAPTWVWILVTAGGFLLFGGIFYWLLTLVPGRYRKSVVAGVTFATGLIYALEYFVPGSGETDRNFLTGLTERINQITTVVYAFALGLGVYSLMQFHGRKLVRRQAGWQNNLAFFLAFFAMALAGFWQMLSPSPMSSNVYNTLYGSTVVALGATMFSTIGFYIVSAAYRAFRIRSGEATLMLIAAFVVMVGQVPVGAFITGGLPETGVLSVLRLENLSYWILKGPNMAAWRGISFGIEIGALAMALRTWLSLERGSFYDREL